MPGLLFLRSVQRGKRRAALAYCDYRQAATEHWNIAMSGAFGWGATCAQGRQKSYVPVLLSR